MEQTAIKAGPAPSAPLPAAVPSSAVTAERPRSVARQISPLYRGLQAIASLRVTVVLFALSIFLVFYGTWAQVDAGIWTVVNKYFRSGIVWIPIKILLMRSVDVPGSLPYPGGWLLGSLLLINLLAAHAVRFKMSWKRSGVLVLHAGLILMMVGELITGLFAIEGHMFIMEGNSSNFVEHDRVVELAVVDRSDPQFDRETVIPGTLLQRDGATIENANLPFDVVVGKYMVNCDIKDTEWHEPGKSTADNPATAGIGLLKIAVARGETTGVDTEQKAEFPSAYVTLKEKGTGKVIGTYLVSTLFSYLQRPLDEVVVNGKRYGFGLRFERDYRDYSIQLKKFSHDVYIGTEKAKNYASKVLVTDPRSPDRSFQYDISMNHPLFYRGETFYQADLHKLAKGTVLQVVRNPGWWLPYISCLLVSGGMLLHFGLHLASFLQKRLGT